MTQPGDALQARLKEVIAEADARRRARRTAMRKEMEVRNERMDRFETLARQWLEAIVTPQLAAFAGLFPNAHPPRAGGLDASVRLDATDEFPASVDLGVLFAHDPADGTIQAQFRARVIPILMDYEREGEVTLRADESESPALSKFLEERLLAFARDYMRILEPDSPYQTEQKVVDPVCGMTLRRWEAASVLQHAGHTYHFCVEDCRRRFEADPARYARS